MRVKLNTIIPISARSRWLTIIVISMLSSSERAAPRPPAPASCLPSAFQERVWKALQEIPAEACAANNLAVAIPCHRVGRNDGALAGYAWGVERKRALINRELTQGA